MEQVRRFDGLDVLRGIAISLVLLRHAFPKFLPGAGIVGVVLFFTLSGYLISGLIASDLRANGTVRWQRFYVHRALRLVPALVGVVALVVVAELAWNISNSRENVWISALIGLTYTADLLSLMPWAMVDSLDHLWTLAVEEQFYLVWPLLLVITLRRGASLQRVAVSCTVGVTALSWLSVAVVGDRLQGLYSLPTTWAATMTMGAWARFADLAGPEGKTRRILFAVGSAAVLGGCAFFPDAKTSPVTYLMGGPIIAIASIGLIVTAGRVATVHGAVAAVGLFLGRVSYGAYLWNLPIVMVAHRLIGAQEVDSRTALVLTIPATILAAWLSWVSVEALGRRWRSIYDQRDSQRTPEAVARSGKNFG